VAIAPQAWSEAPIGLQLVATGIEDSTKWVLIIKGPPGLVGRLEKIRWKKGWPHTKKANETAQAGASLFQRARGRCGARKSSQRMAKGHAFLGWRSHGPSSFGLPMLNQAYANNRAIVFAPAVACTSGRMPPAFLWLPFLPAHHEAEAFVKQVVAMDVVAAQPNLEDDFFKSKRAAFFNALKCKTGLILTKATAMHVNANLEPSSLGHPAPSRSFARHHLVSLPILIKNCVPLALDYNILVDRIVPLW
jgi:hypothetical protein